MKTHFFRIFFLIVSVVFANEGQAQTHDSTLLSQLKSLRSLQSEQPIVAESLFSSAVDSLEAGDTTLVPAFLDIAPYADGEWAELIGAELGGILLRNPGFFVRSIATRSPKEQSDLAWDAFNTDGSGMSEDDYAHARRMLDSLQFVLPAYHSTIDTCLSVLNLIEAQKK